MINNTFFAVFVFLRSSIIPKPEFTNNPDSKAPNGIAPSINNSVINKLEAQFGIRPMIEQYNGERYLLDSKKFLKLSSPTKPMMNPIAKLITNM